MLLNIVNNARTATDGAGTVIVTASATAAEVLVTIEDNGPGIAAHDAEHIFEPFYTTSSSGTGLGLAVARSIARSHHGDLTLDSGCQTGARFRLMLPLPAQAERVTSDRTLAITPRQTATRAL
jgi:signal transduction histidine kinase